MGQNATTYMPFKMGSEEVVVKDYNAVIMKLPHKMTGHIILTNKRAILYAYSESLFGLSRESLLNDVHLDEVKGVTAYIGSKKSITNMVIGIFLIIVGLFLSFWGIMLSTGYYGGGEWIMIILGFILIIVGIILVVWRTKSIYVHIKAARVPGIEIGVMKKGPVQIFGTKPGPDAERMVYEISAVIADLQKQSGVKEMDEL